MGDLMTVLSVARKGFGEMAMTGCYAGPLFNMLFGFGISTLMVNLKPNGQKIVFTYRDSMGDIPLIMSCGVLFMMIWTIFIATVQKFQITLLQAKLKIAIYTFIIVIVTVFSIY